MKREWKLLVPNWSHLDEIWRSAKPFCLWPIGSQPFIAHWMDYAVSSGVERVDFFVCDRPTEVRKFLKNGSYWSRRISINSIASDEAAPEDAIPLLGLPHDNKIQGSLDSPADLQKHWFSLNLIWLDRIDEHEFHIERQQSRQGWVGPQSRISPKATLTPPYWIQGRCDIAGGAQIGPNACIGENTIIDSNAIVQNSIVLPGTLVGRNTNLDQVAVDGGLLLNIQRGCRVNVSDSFILSDLAGRAKKASIGERIAAILLFAFISPLVALSRIDWTTVEVYDGRGGQLRLKTGVNGRLLCRRWHWLKEVFKGRMRLIGILPRPLEWDIENDRELGQRLKESSPGLFSLADLHGCHEASETNEWIHASYQALEAEKNISKMIRSKFWKLAFKRVA